MQNRTTAIWQIRRVRTTQAGWYACAATNLVNTTVRYTYMHVVTSFTPPAEFEGLEYPDVPGPLRTRRPSETHTQARTTPSLTTGSLLYSPTTSIQRKSIQYLSIELDTSTAVYVARGTSSNQVQTPLTVIVSEMKDQQLQTTSNPVDLQGNNFSKIVGICVILTLVIIVVVVVVVVVICCRRKNRHNKRYSVRRRTMESLNGEQRGNGETHGRKTSSSERMPLHDHTVRSDQSFLKDQSYSSNQSVWPIILQQPIGMTNHSPATNRLSVWPIILQQPMGVWPILLQQPISMTNHTPTINRFEKSFSSNQSVWNDHDVIDDLFGSSDIEWKTCCNLIFLTVFLEWLLAS